MKKPLMLIPPAQAEALYDATLHETRSRKLLTSAFSSPSRSWDVSDWDEEENLSSSAEDKRYARLDSFKAQD